MPHKRTIIQRPSRDCLASSLGPPPPLARSPSLPETPNTTAAQTNYQYTKIISLFRRYNKVSSFSPAGGGYIGLECPGRAGRRCCMRWNIKVLCYSLLLCLYFAWPMAEWIRASRLGRDVQGRGGSKFSAIVWRHECYLTLQPIL